MRQDQRKVSDPSRVSFTSLSASRTTVSSVYETVYDWGRRALSRPGSYRVTIRSLVPAGMSLRSRSRLSALGSRLGIDPSLPRAESRELQYFRSSGGQRVIVTGMVLRRGPSGEAVTRMWC